MCVIAVIHVYMSSVLRVLARRCVYDNVLLLLFLIGVYLASSLQCMIEYECNC